MVHIQTYEDKLKEECMRSIKSTISCKECSKEQREVLSNYNQYLERKNLSLQGRRIELVHLKNLLLALKKDISKLKKEDIDRYLREIDQKYKPKTKG